jgi:tetratricopeptide (TPR) repeat protein
LFSSKNVSYTDAVKSFYLARDVALMEKDTNKALEAYIALANVYKEMKEYENALKCYKICLVYAWLLNDSAKEIQIYDKLSIMNFYLGEIDKS